MSIKKSPFDISLPEYTTLTMTLFRICVFFFVVPCIFALFYPAIYMHSSLNSQRVNIFYMTENIFFKMNICFNADNFGLINSSICKYQMIAIRTKTMGTAIPAELHITITIGM